VFKSRRRLQFEQLENRTMMAGDVAAVMQNGSLYLTEAAGQAGRDNGVLISELANGMIRIQGTSPSGAASLVNGAAYQDFSVKGSLFVNFGAGNDKVEFSAIGPAIQLQSVNLNLGLPTVGAGVSDKDTVSLQNFQTTAGLSISTGADDDHVYVSGGIVGNYQSSDQLWIRTGAGADYVSIQGTDIRGQLFVQTFDALSENDIDTLYLDKNVIVHGDATLLTGGGADQVFLGVNGTQSQYALDVTGSLSLDTGDGADQVTVYNAFIGWGLNSTTVIQTGAGADHVDIDGPNTWLTSLNLLTYSQLSEVDADVVSIRSVILGGSAWVRTGGGDDQFTSSPSDPSKPNLGVTCTGTLWVDTGAGNDTVAMSAVCISINASDKLSIRTGAGADTVTLSHCMEAGSLLNVEIVTYDSLAETDADRVTITGVYVGKSLNIWLGGGNDAFTLAGGSYSGNNIYVDAGAGNDRGSVNGLAAVNDITLKMGDGDDFLSVDNVYHAHQLNMLGDAGSDTESRTNAVAVDALFESGWEYFQYFNPINYSINPITGGLSKAN
jgi:hypothetical protein